MANKLSYIEINDIFDELIDENERLKQYLKALIKFIEKMKSILDLNYLQEFQQLSEEIEDIFSQQMVINVNNINNETKEINDKINTSSDSKTSHNLSKTSDNKDLDKNQTQSPDEDICSEKSMNKKESIICDFIGCGKYFKTKKSLKRHALNHNTEYKFVCDYNGCDYKTQRNWLLQSHINIHKNIRDFVCNTCGKGFVTINSLNSHIKGVHKNSEPISCNICDKVLKNQYSLKAHQILCHLKEELISCDFPNCHYKCVSNSMLITHQIRHSNERTFVCTYDGCATAYTFKHLLDDHILLCHNPKGEAYKCLHEGCGKAFKTLDRLSIHSNTHLEQIFKCDWPGCEYQSLSKRVQTLQRHMVSHSSELNFVCVWPQCGKRFKTKRYLERHYRIHTNDKKHVCYWPGGQYRCVSSSNLSGHIKQVHKKIKICRRK